MTDKRELSENNVGPDPFKQFLLWYTARLGSGTGYPGAMSLGTASEDGRVSIRTVLLKEFDEKGFVFYTNHNSKKATQIAVNPSGALLFYWAEFSRQIRIEGTIIKISDAESELYFATRPRESQIGAWASEQSSVIPDRKYLIDRFKCFESRYTNRQIEKPGFWGGYRLEPDWFEFWQEGDFRLHDRVIYKRSKNGWIINRLAP